jgi:hypothetical protein
MSQRFKNVFSTSPTLPHGPVPLFLPGPVFGQRTWHRHGAPPIRGVPDPQLALGVSAPAHDPATRQDGTRMGQSSGNGRGREAWEEGGFVQLVSVSGGRGQLGGEAAGFWPWGLWACVCVSVRLCVCPRSPGWKTCLTAILFDHYPVSPLSRLTTITSDHYPV